MFTANHLTDTDKRNSAVSERPDS